MITFKRISKVNLNDNTDDLYIVNKARRRKYMPLPFDDDEEYDKAWDENLNEPKERKYEDVYQMSRLRDMSVSRIHRALSKPHLIFRFNEED